MTGPGDDVQRRRERLNLTKADLARRAHVSRTTLAAVEAGHAPQVRSLTKIDRALQEREQEAGVVGEQRGTVGRRTEPQILDLSGLSESGRSRIWSLFYRLLADQLEEAERLEHLSECKQQALELVDQDQPRKAFASLATGLSKDGSIGHSGLELGLILLLTGELDTAEAMRGFIEGLS